MGDNFTTEELETILMDMESFLESFLDNDDDDTVEIEDLPLNAFIELEDDEILTRQSIIKKIKEIYNDLDIMETCGINFP